LETPVYIPPAFIKQYPETIKSNLKGTTQPLSRETAIKTVKAFIEAIPSYHDLFVEGESKIKNLDTLITSVGDLGTGFGSFTEQQQQPLLLDKKEREALLQDAVGDIAGRYVTKDGDTGKEGSAIAKVNERIFGLTLDNLEEIARRKPGVIVIASSRKKARVILALLKRPKKVISELIISGDLAEELANLLDKR
jgi:DNA-binding transcriptional regulator LsrR (DeoR family)